MNLAEKLQQLGYEIEIDGRTGAPEIKGFSAEYLKESSPRSAEIRQEAELIKARLEAEGATVKEGAGLKQAAARADRASKEYDRAEMRERIMEMEEKYDFQARRLFEQSLERGPLARSQEEEIARARQAVESAREMANLQGPDMDIRQAWAHALRESTSLTTYETVKAEMEASIARGEFLGLARENQMHVEATNSLAPAERADGLQLDNYEREGEIERVEQSLSYDSHNQNPAASSNLAGESTLSPRDESLATGAEELAEDLEIETALELGFGL